jgi:hypothetical protein
MLIILVCTTSRTGEKSRSAVLLKKNAFVTANVLYGMGFLGIEYEMFCNDQVKRAPSLEDLTGLSADEVNQETRKCLIKSKLRQISYLASSSYNIRIKIQSD